jgi:glucose/arabinose dehydrogenase
MKTTLKKAAIYTLLPIIAFGISGCASETNTPHPPPVSGPPELSLTRVLTGFSNPLGITHTGDGTGRLFIVERGGKIWLVKSGSSQKILFLDVSDRVITAGGEQGLLGLAFPADYAGKDYFYVHYTGSPDGRTVVSRIRLSSDPDSADPSTEEVLLTTAQPFGNHNGGQLQFGPDGYLYIGLGDGGSGGDPLKKAQDLTSLLGKILRIDVESDAEPYDIPSDNPFVNDPNAASEIWALGLRNPWRFSFDGATGDLYIGDVGQSSLEEINVQAAGSPGGENYGWSIMEGTRCFGSPSCDTTGISLPVAEYDHSQGECSVTGGSVYRGDEFPAMRGIYFYGDFCSGRIWGLQRQGAFWENVFLLDSPYLISTFGEDEAGSLYLADYASGDIYRITPVQ